VFRTHTHKGQGFNELTFEDERGREEIYVHAQKDRNEKVRNNHTERIDNNWVQSVGHNKGVHVEGNHDEVVGGNMTLSVGRIHMFNFLPTKLLGVWTGIGSAANNLKSLASKIPTFGNWHVFVQSSMVKFIGFAYSRNVGQDFMSSIGRDETRSTAGNLTTSVGGNSTETVNGVKVMQSDGQIDIESGASSVHLFKDGTIVIDGKQLFIDIDGEVEINGKKINLN
jgi:type VI secretion system secreted protein VgrG